MVAVHGHDIVIGPENKADSCIVRPIRTEAVKPPVQGRTTPSHQSGRRWSQDQVAQRALPWTWAPCRRELSNALLLSSAHPGAHECCGLVEGLVEISRFDARASELHLDDVDMTKAVGKSLERRRRDDDRVVTDLPHGILARLDPRRFDVVLANLVGNALRHSGVPVRIAVRTEPCLDGERLLVEVAESGPGIAREALPHSFDRCFEADAARTRSASSGLAITLENVRLHGGTLHAAGGPRPGILRGSRLHRRHAVGGPRMTRAKAVSTAAAAALAGTLLLSACGIRPTGVIGSGEAAHVKVPGAEVASTLYFISPEGRLIPSPQSEPLRVPPAQLLTRLLEGPDSREREAGITTALPRVTGKRIGSSVVSYSERDVLAIKLAFKVGDLTPLARSQLVCTLASTGSPGVKIKVALAGTDTSLGAARCDIGR